MRNLVLDTYQESSFRGVSFLFNNSEQSGGRKSHTFEYPNQDIRYVQDLGKYQRIYRIKAYIFQNDAGYISSKDQLVDALEQEGSGVLVHPTDGVKTVFAGPYTVIDSIEQLGVAEFDLTFYETGSQIFPTTSTSNATTIAAQINTFLNDVNSDFASAWATTSTYQGSAEYSASLLQNMIDNFENATSIATSDTDALNIYNASVTTFTDDKFSNVYTGTSVADGINTIFDNMGELSDDSEDRYSIISSFFSYDPDSEIDQTTVSREQQEKNRVSANAIINVYALAYAYLFTTQTSFDTEDDIETRNQILDDQFFFILGNNTYVDAFGNRTNIVSVETFDLLQNLRYNAHQYLRNEINNTRKVITIDVKRDSLLTLVYSYYGDIDLIDIIASLNDTVDPSKISGDYKVLTDES